jgi:hypothetical protein
MVSFVFCNVDFKKDTPMNLTIPPFVPAMAQRPNLSIPNMSKPTLKMPQLQRSGQHTPEQVKAITSQINGLLTASKFCKNNKEAYEAIMSQIDNLADIFGASKQQMLEKLKTVKS